MFKRNTQLNDYRKDGRLAYNSFIKNNGGFINKESNQQKVRKGKYFQLRDEYMKLHPICEYPFCSKISTELHHKAGRIGKNMFKYFMACCSEHHSLIHQFPAISFENGWLIKNN